ncbi:PAS domain S-box-containing protein [Syntrophus gentianae]|uniref:histidine kinase n=2 Tax=Syntrophus gentianae TaxID=43775 RepID=A0A1H7WHS2_9BACT|nr:PAS domain S-box-containing protein [Syntrophus gentianae]
MNKENRIMEKEKVTVFPGQVGEASRGSQKNAEPEDQFLYLFENFPDAILLADQWEIIDCNPAAVRMLAGSSKDDIIGRNVEQFFPPTQPDGRSSVEASRNLWKLTLKKKSVQMEWMHRDLAGRDFPVSVSMVMVSRDGKALCYLIWRDLREREERENILRSAAEFNSTIIEGLAEGIVIYDRNLCYLAWNPFMERLTGLTSDQVVGVHAPSLFPHIYANGLDVLIKQALTGETATSPDFSCIPSPKAAERWLSALYAPYRNASGEIIGVVGLLRDVTERRWTEQALRDSEEKIRSLSELAVEGIVIHREGVILEANATLARLLGYESPEAVAGRNVLSFVAPPFVEMASRKIRVGKNGIYHVDIQRNDGSIFPAEFNVREMLYRGKAARVVAIRDLSEHQRNAEALLREKERFRSFIEESPFGVTVIGSDGRYQYINPKFTELFGYSLEDVPTGREWFRKAHPDPDYRHRIIAQWKNYVLNLRHEGTPLLTFEVTCKDGSEKSIQYRPIAMATGEFLIMYEDFTERKRLEEQLRQSEKLEAIGTLAGGIAHDFNNLLMGIQGYTSILQHSLGTGHRDYEKLNSIQKLIQSGSDLTQQLLGFARGGKYEIKPTDLNDILIKSSNMFGRTRRDIVISCDLEEPLWLVEADRSQIEQVLLNLYVNAGQAMPGGGRLNLATKNVVPDDDPFLPASREPGNYVCVTVTDTGVGMDEKTRQRIFEPFFTTREMKRGTGLGLASAYGIIQGHGGSIEVDSEIGRGTTFRIYLPASDKEIPGTVRPVADVAKGHETILLVDDEEINIEVVSEILEMLGYSVFTAQSGQDAVHFYQSKKDTVDLVLLDMIMPGMGGGDTFDALKEIDPGVKVILSSGYSLHGEASRIMERGCSAFIQKPFRIEELSGKLEEVLGRKQ